MKKIFLITAIILSTAFDTMAQTSMRNIFAQLPDSILPFLTRNNRLDCIDFIENGMEARVKNVFDDNVVLNVLTEDYLSIDISEGATVEMKMLMGEKDTIICVNRIYKGPAEDSEVRLYNLSWHMLSRVDRPSVSEFIKLPQPAETVSVHEQDTLAMLRAEAEVLPLIKASLSPQNTDLRWTLQSAEFSKDLKKVAERYLQPVVMRLEPWKTEPKVDVRRDQSQR